MRGTAAPETTCQKHMYSSCIEDHKQEKRFFYSLKKALLFFVIIVAKLTNSKVKIISFICFSTEQQKPHSKLHLKRKKEFYTSIYITVSEFKENK